MTDPRLTHYVDQLSGAIIEIAEKYLRLWAESPPKTEDEIQVALDELESRIIDVPLFGKRKEG